MNSVYLDNAATTPMAPEVIEAMLPYMNEHFGNPSSTHHYGRKTKNAIEKSRKSIAKHLNADAGEIIFTSGGTEADNMALHCAVKDLGVTRIITSTIEHHAVGHTAEGIAEKNPNIKLEYVFLHPNGSVNVEHLEELLKDEQPTLVSLMHGNNEIGNLIDLDVVSKLCRKYDAYFHSDTVQTMGHYTFDLKALDIDFLTCAAHKFHGPKGVGFLYKNKSLPIKQLICGGSQERNLRGGTENLYGIIGLAKAMDLAYEDVLEHQEYVQRLKDKMKAGLKKIDSRIKINGETDPNKSLYTVLNVCFPLSESNEMMLFTLDLNGVAASGGSACSSGSNKGSHVLASLNGAEYCNAIRFSFSRYTTDKCIEYALAQVSECSKLFEKEKEEMSIG